MPYLPHTKSQKQEMLRTLGVDSIEELFSDVPPQVRHPPLSLPPPLSELELMALLRDYAGANLTLEGRSSFLGAGAYRHFIPAVVDELLRRGEFSTAYTPYQAEASQGTLTAIYEFQTMIANLYGMEVANASMYDGATALAEAALMAARITGREEIAISRTVHLECRQVLKTYVQGLGLPVREVEYDPTQGRTSPTSARELVKEETACLIVQTPNTFGILEELEQLSELAQDAGALFVVSADPIAMGLFKPPGEAGADIVVGEGQPLGIPLSFGGPYLGLFASRMHYVRQMPGRLVGMTQDVQGRRGFVLTLQTREQHIRRERATSNICSNEALAALAATIYLACLGRQGLRKVAQLCYHRGHYAAERLSELPGCKLLFRSLFFREFALQLPKAPQEVNGALLERGIVGGYDLTGWYPELTNAMLFCVTEMNSKEEIEGLAKTLGEVLK